MNLPENDNDKEGKPGLGCFLVILAGCMGLYLFNIIAPKRWNATPPTWDTFLKNCVFVVLPISLFLWLGFYLFGERFFDMLNLMMKIVAIVIVLATIFVVVFAISG